MPANESERLYCMDKSLDMDQFHTLDKYFRTNYVPYVANINSAQDKDTS